MAARLERIHERTCPNMVRMKTLAFPRKTSHSVFEGQADFPQTLGNIEVWS